MPNRNKNKNLNEIDTMDIIDIQRAEKEGLDEIYDETKADGSEYTEQVEETGMKDYVENEIEDEVEFNVEEILYSVVTKINELSTMIQIIKENQKEIFDRLSYVEEEVRDEASFNSEEMTEFQERLDGVEETIKDLETEMSDVLEEINLQRGDLTGIYDQLAAIEEKIEGGEENSVCEDKSINTDNSICIEYVENINLYCGEEI